MRWQDAGRITRVNTGFLNVLHDPRDPNLIPIAEGININLNCVLKESIQEDLLATTVSIRTSARYRAP